jgi:hypothetical protein
VTCARACWRPYPPGVVLSPLCQDAAPTPAPHSGRSDALAHVYVCVCALPPPYWRNVVLPTAPVMWRLQGGPREEAQTRQLLKEVLAVSDDKLKATAQVAFATFSMIDCLCAVFDSANAV